LKIGWFSCGRSTTICLREIKPKQENTPLKKQYRDLTQKATSKSKENLKLECALPMAELIQGMSVEIESFSAQLGLQIMRAVMEGEIESRLGHHGSQSHYRHGGQPGYVVYGGRKITLERPRMRTVDGREAELKSYGAFQQEGKMQSAVARQLVRQCSTRNYEGALDDCLEGYGIKKSSVSRQWKAASAAELEKLCSRPVAEDLVALLIDGKHMKKDCVVVALGVKADGAKQVLGIWHGASENSTTVKALLEDLVERGLCTSRSILVVIDGAKALRKAVRALFGEHALIQRCRVHKRRNVLEHLPKEKQRQALWRLKAAWAESDPDKAEAELRKTVKWLETTSPGAARSLEEGLEETLTVTRLGLHEDLIKTFASTNLIESCFSRTEQLTGRVKRWRSGEMFLRWTGAALLFAEKGFRKVRGYRHLHQLSSSLKNQFLDGGQIAA
jgi:putative transposase